MRINKYTCEKCGAVVVTRDRDEGTTPYMLACGLPYVATVGCQGYMRSSFYRVNQTLGDEAALIPTMEWYRPSAAELELEVQKYAARRKYAIIAHVQQGGLLIRSIT